MFYLKLWSWCPTTFYPLLWTPTKHQVYREEPRPQALVQSGRCVRNLFGSRRLLPTYTEMRSDPPSPPLPGPPRRFVNKVGHAPVPGAVQGAIQRPSPLPTYKTARVARLVHSADLDSAQLNLPLQNTTLYLHSTTTTSVERKNKDGTKTTVPIPDIVADYNRHMGQ